MVSTCDFDSQNSSSILLPPAKLGFIAQSVEQWTFNPLVESSNLSEPTSYYEKIYFIF